MVLPQQVSGTKKKSTITPRTTQRTQRAQHTQHTQRSPQTLLATLRTLRTMTYAPTTQNLILLQQIHQEVQRRKEVFFSSRYS
jgi:hypothetical protein